MGIQSADRYVREVHVRRLSGQRKQFQYENGVRPVLSFSHIGQLSQK